MSHLSQPQFERARGFLQARGRPLERALFAHEFEGSDADPVVQALANYQNADGGFGHALEPDVRTPSSSALATSIALGILAALGTPAESPQLAGALGYLRGSLDSQGLVWRIVPTDANEHPHAPWWHDEDGSVAQAFGGFAINPRAELVGELWSYRAAVPADWLEEVTEATVVAVEARELDPHELICAAKLAESEALPERYKSRVAPRVVERARGLVARDPAQWREYNPQPLWYVSSPRSLLAEALADSIPANLDFLIEQQSAEGSWAPNWSWGDFHAEAWPRAELDASSLLTLRALRQLRAFGRIEGQVEP